MASAGRSCGAAGQIEAERQPVHPVSTLIGKVLGEPPHQLDAVPANCSLFEVNLPGPGNDAERIESRSEVSDRDSDRIVPQFNREVDIPVDPYFAWSMRKAMPGDVRHCFLEAELNRK